LIHVIERLPGEPGVEHAFSWDGRTNTNQQALLGAYSVRLVALDAREAEVSSTMYRDGRIEAVDLSFGELNYVLEGGEVVATGKLRRLG
jgi:hypothetical protein